LTAAAPIAAPASSDRVAPGHAENDDKALIRNSRLTYGSADMLNWIVNEKKIAPHIPVIDKSKREDGTFSRKDFKFEQERNIYLCPGGKVLTPITRSATRRHCRTVVPTYSNQHCAIFE
jgi:hypothetical protein